MNFLIIASIFILFNVVYSSFHQQNQCSFMTNIDYFGNDLPGSPCPARSTDECCALCQNNPYCQAWTFVCDPNNPSCSLCYLKACVGSDIRCLANRYSGVKQVPAPTTNCVTTAANCITTAANNCITTAQNYLCIYFSIC